MRLSFFFVGVIFFFFFFFCSRPEMYNGSIGSGDDMGLMDSEGTLDQSTASYSYDPGSPLPPPVSDDDGFLPPPPPDMT